MIVLIALAMGLAGGLGAVVRHLAADYLPSPWGIMLVNVTGSFLAGVFSRFGATGGSELWAITIVGFLGGFTTYSTHAIDTHELQRTKAAHHAVMHAFGTLVMCVGAVLLGFAVGDQLL